LGEAIESHENAILSHLATHLPFPNAPNCNTDMLVPDSQSHALSALRPFGLILTRPMLAKDPAG